MESFFARHKNATILAVVLAVQILGLASQIKRQTETGPVRLVRFWAVYLVTPIERAYVHTEDWIRGGWRNYFYLRGVRRENAELREQIERMRLEQVRMEQDAAQARRIQALLQFKEQYISKTVAAQVIGTSGSETSHLIYIDRGSSDGIQPNMAVITPTGIVGKVLRVFPNTSQVLEITDQTSGVGATLSKSRLQGVLKGQPSGHPNLAHIMSDETVEQGEEVITSGGDRIFPKGLPIGKVVSVSPGKDSFLNVRVAPSANLSHLEEVLVIAKIEDKDPDTKGLGPIRAADILAQRLPSVPEKPVEAAAAPGTTTAPGATHAASGSPATIAPSAAATTSTPKPATGAASAAAPKPASTPGQTAAKPNAAAGAQAASMPRPNTAGSTAAKPAASGTTANGVTPRPATGGAANSSVAKPASGAGATTRPATTASGANTKPAAAPGASAAGAGAPRTTTAAPAASKPAGSGAPARPRPVPAPSAGSTDNSANSARTAQDQ